MNVVEELIWGSLFQIAHADAVRLLYGKPEEEGLPPCTDPSVFSQLAAVKKFISIFNEKTSKRTTESQRKIWEDLRALHRKGMREMKALDRKIEKASIDKSLRDMFLIGSTVYENIEILAVWLEKAEQLREA